MDDKIYTVTMADGTKLSGLRMNGNNFISTAKITTDMFAGNCSPVIISDGEVEERHEYMALVQITENNGEYWFVLRDIPEHELRFNQMEDLLAGLLFGGDGA